MEYIRKQSLLADLNETTPHSYFAFETMVRAYPTEDVVPVVHAHWRYMHRSKRFGLYVGACSHCGSPNIAADYCGTCGAKMDEEVGNGK